MENNPKEMWTFDNFFHEADQILQKTEIVCLDTTKPWSVILYLNKNQT